MKKIYKRLSDGEKGGLVDMMILKLFAEEPGRMILKMVLVVVIISFIGIMISGHNNKE